MLPGSPNWANRNSAIDMGNALVGQRQHLDLERMMRTIRLLHIEGQCGLAVGGGWHHDLVPGALGGAMRLDEMPDCGRTFVPAKVWRHLPDRILSKKLDDPLHVVVLERGYVVSEKSFACSSSRCSSGLSASSLCTWALARCKLLLTAAVDMLQQLGHLAGLPREYVTQDQDRTLRRGEMLQGRDERQPNAFSIHNFGSRVIGGTAPDHGVGHRLQPGHLRPRLQRTVGIGAGLAEAQLASADEHGRRAR